MKTQKELVIEYVKTFGEIVPAKIGGKQWNGGFFGSETSKRCRELRHTGELLSHKEGKFEVYTLSETKAAFDKMLGNPIEQINALFQVDQINYKQ